MRLWPSPRIALSALACGLALALAFELSGGRLWIGYSPIAAHRDATMKSGPNSVLPDFGMSAEASLYSDIVDRPLFSPTRMRAPTQIVTAAPEPAKSSIRRGLYQLTGVTDLGLIKIAHLREVATNRVRSVREGDALQELTVKTITATQITLAYEGNVDLIELPKFTPSGRIPVPAPAQPPSPLQAQAQPPPTPQAQTPLIPAVAVATAPVFAGAGSVSASALSQTPAPLVAESREQAALRQAAAQAWGGKM